MKRSIFIIVSVLFVLFAFAQSSDQMIRKIGSRYNSRILKVTNSTGKAFCALNLSNGIMISNYSLNPGDRIVDLNNNTVKIDASDLIKVDNGLYFYKNPSMKKSALKGAKTDYTEVQWYFSLQVLSDGDLLYSSFNTAPRDFEKDIQAKRLRVIFNNDGELLGLLYNYHVTSFIKTIFMNCDRINEVEVEDAFSGKFLDLEQLQKLADRPVKTRAWLGITLRIHNNLISIASVYEDSPAEKAGFKKGDIIVKVGKEEMLRVEDVINSIGSRSSGETVMIEVIRDGDRMKIKAELGSKAELNKYMIKRKLEKIKKVEVNTSDILEEKLERLEKELEEIKEMLRKD